MAAPFVAREDSDDGRSRSVSPGVHSEQGGHSGPPLQRVAARDNMPCLSQGPGKAIDAALETNLGGMVFVRAGFGAAERACGGGNVGQGRDVFGRVLAEAALARVVDREQNTGEPALRFGRRAHLIIICRSAGEARNPRVERVQ